MPKTDCHFTAMFSMKVLQEGQDDPYKLIWDRYIDKGN